jgi:hypothetical protein
MDTSSDRISLDPVPIPEPRGVYSERLPGTGERIYRATTSTGALLNGEIRRRAEGETEDMIIREMWRDLNRQDPVGATTPTRPQLVLSRSAPRRGRGGSRGRSR